MRTYLYGYATPTARLTVAELGTRPTWTKLDPELRRRLLALFDAAQDAGTDVGLGGGWRSSALQEATFRDRYYVVPCPGGVVRWDGNGDGVVECWKKRDGVAAAAPPGRSYHESTTPEGFALAADLIGDLGFVGVHATRFGMHDFSDVNAEPWHVQPTEIPNARSNYDPARHVLAVPEPPAPPADESEEDDEDMARKLWKDERYHDVFQTAPCVAPVDKVHDGETVEVGRHHRTLRSLATMCGFGFVSRLDWTDVPVDEIPDEPA